MRLRRIEAEAFGALKECSLAHLGDGLTVVFGPNESGKSSYAALVRQILYGFPDKRTKDQGYQPKSGGRAGRLVFDDATGEWAIARAEGPRGGVIRVDALRGADRPHALADIVGNVTEQTFRVVFGFGLDELNDIESGTDSAVVARLFAGTSGLAVNPMDVRKALFDASGALFKTRGNSEVGTLIAQIRDTKARIRDIETQARDFADEQSRLKELAERLDPLKASRDQADLRLRDIERDIERASALSGQLAESLVEIESATTERDARRLESGRIVVDERMLQISADLSALLQEESGAKQRSEHAKQLDSRAAELRRKAAALGAAGEVADTAEARAALEEWRGRKARLEADAEAKARAAVEAEVRARAYAEAGEEPVPAGGRGSAGTLAAWGLLAFGLAGAAAGALTQQSVALGIGIAAALAGIVVLLLGGRRRTGEGPDISAEARRLAAEATAASELAETAHAAIEAAAAQWSGWLAERGLAGRGTDPAAVTSLLDDARERAKLEDQAAADALEAERDRAQAAEWAERLRSLVRGPLGIAEAAPEPHALAIRAREALDATLAARENKMLAAQASETAETERARVEQKLARLEADLGSIAAKRGIEGDLTAGLEAAANRAREELDETRTVFEGVSNEHAQLAGRLGTQGRDDALARERQLLEGLTARARATADRYLVEALAVRLVDRARERYERDRQPDVVRTAARVFEAMTDGRYTGVRVPLGGESVTVVTSSGSVVPTSQLSRGTAEQLYLALRVGLIQSFGEQGPHLPVLMDDIVVNYDAERMKGAAAAIAELASSRQVIFFTCHEATASTLATAVPGATSITLDRCSL